MDIIYCYKCGNKLTQTLDRYDVFTGKLISTARCDNLYCEVACGRVGHKYKLFGLVCQRCGFRSGFK